MLEGTNSRIAFIIHDEIVIDMSESDRYLIPKLKKEFMKTKIGNFMVNVKAGKNYGSMKDLNL